MFEKLKEKIKDLTSSTPDVSPEQFDDPVAMQTKWTPAKKGGASFKTHQLVEINSGRIEFKTSFGAKLFACVFLFIVIGGAIGIPIVLLSTETLSLDDKSTMIFLLFDAIFGLIFFLAGGWMLYSFTKPIVFDKRSKYFWKGRKSPEQVFNKKDLKSFVKLENIYAIQLISEYCSGDKSSYYSYELNLVLEDGERINVVDHGNKKQLREDSKILSSFLKIPLWDAI